METKEDIKTKKSELLNWLKPQKRDGLTSGSDKSSGAKSTSTPSTPASNHILPIESRPSYSSPSECTSVGFLSEAKQDSDINKDDFLQQEAPLVQVPDSEVIQEQINQKNNECKGLEETITALKQLLSEKKIDKSTIPISHWRLRLNNSKRK